MGMGGRDERGMILKSIGFLQPQYLVDARGIDTSCVGQDMY